MADQTDFKHITVNPAEADDVVIHAGAPVQCDEGATAAAGTPDTGSGDVAARRDGSASASAASSSSSPFVTASSEGGAEKAPSATPKRQDAYRQTTLEDIQSFKMSKTQIAVIVMALAAIAAFVVWYLVFS